MPERGADNVMDWSAIPMAAARAATDGNTWAPFACGAAPEPRVTASLVFVASTAVTVSTSESTMIILGGTPFSAGATVIGVSVDVTAASSTAIDAAPGGTIAISDPGGNPLTVCVFTVLSVTVTVWFPYAPGNLAVSATSVSLRVP